MSAHIGGLLTWQLSELRGLQCWSESEESQGQEPIKASVREPFSRSARVSTKIGNAMLILTGLILLGVWLIAASAMPQ